VLTSLRERGIGSEREVSNVTTPTVMITAHGTSQHALNLLRERNLNVIEATCPLVHVAHRAVARLVQSGFHPVIIGKRDHVEVRGLTEDLAEFDVVLSEAEVDALKERPRFGIAAQTTQPIERVGHLVALIEQRFPKSEIRFIDTVCQPTKQRQLAAIELTKQCEVIVVIGGAHSNNTRELVATCSRYCARVYHVQAPDGLRPEWFSGAQSVGITAGTSTPDEVIDLVEQGIRGIAARQSQESSRRNLTLELNAV